MNTNMHSSLGSASDSFSSAGPLASQIPPSFSRGDILGSAHKARTMSATTAGSRTTTGVNASDVLVSPGNCSPAHASGILSAATAVSETSPQTSPQTVPANTAASAGPGAHGNTTGSNGQANGTSSGTTSDENPLKRRNTDVVDYPRRRATIACEVCRSRKSRCDGGKPKCKLCTELGAECVYREPGIKLDAGDKLILERLSNIESLLQHLMTGGGTASTTASGSASATASCGVFCAGSAVAGGNCGTDMLGLLFPNTHGTMGGNNGVGGHMNTHQQFPHVATDAVGSGAAANSSINSWPALNTSLSSMPRTHNYAALSLLHWPLIRRLVPQPPEPQALLHLELSREPLNSLTKTPCVDLSNTQAYTAAFFAHVNVWYACVNPFTWRAHYRTALSNGFREGPESCITLLVLALGQASLRGSISRLSAHDEPPGLQYFTAAWALLPGMMTANSVLAGQCHLLAAAYLFYLVRPLEAWNLLCMTSSKLQLLLMSPTLVPSNQRELVERIYWNTLLFENDLLSELDLPHSGLASFEEHVSLPSGFEDDSISSAVAAAASSIHVDGDQVGHDDLWYFLADIALRRILNRVLQAIHLRDTSTSIPALEPIVAELDFQLSQWYDSLPLPLQFPFARLMLQDPVQTVLRLKFFACRTIIYRPYVLAVMENESVFMVTAVRDNCIKCLEAAVRQLEHITEHHHGHMPYLWQGSLSIVSQTLLIMGASMCPSLMEILLEIIPQSEALDLMINKVLVEVEQYAALAPSLGLASDILKEAEIHRRAFLA